MDVGDEKLGSVLPASSCASWGCGVRITLVLTLPTISFRCFCGIRENLARILFTVSSLRPARFFLPFPTFPTGGLTADVKHVGCCRTAPTKALPVCPSIETCSWSSCIARWLRRCWGCCCGCGCCKGCCFNMTATASASSMGSGISVSFRLGGADERIVTVLTFPSCGWPTSVCLEYKNCLNVHGFLSF